MLENLAFPDDLSSVFLIFIIFCCTCFLRNDSPVRSVLRFRSYASTLSRLVSSAQESQKLILFFYYVKHINSIRKSSIFEPFQQGTPLDLYFLSEIHLLDVSHSRRTNLDFDCICGCSASTLPHIIQLCQNSMRDVPHFRRTYVDIYRICA